MKIYLRSYDFQIYACGLTQINIAKTVWLKEMKSLSLGIFSDLEEMNYGLLQLRRLKIGTNFLAKAVHSPTY